jgi:hypothetical protein
MGLPALQSQAIQAGAFGQGRGQVAEAEYQAASDRNRAASTGAIITTRFWTSSIISCTTIQFTNQVGLAGQSTQDLLGQQIAGIKYTRCTTTSTRIKQD